MRCVDSELFTTGEDGPGLPPHLPFMSRFKQGAGGVREGVTGKVWLGLPLDTCIQEAQAGIMIL